MLSGAAIAIATFFIVDLPHGPEHWSSDLQVAWLSKVPSTQNSRILIVEVKEDALNGFASISPVDRGLLATAVRKLAALEPAAIGLDFVFERATEAAKDKELMDAIKASPVPVVVGVLDDRTALTPGQRSFQTQFLSESGARPGHVYFGGHESALLLTDSVIREIAEPNDRTGIKSFAEVLSDVSGGPNALKSRKISWLLKPSDPRNLETFSSLRVESLNMTSDQLLRSIVRGRTVLVGGNFFDRDRFVTPLSLRYDGRQPGMMIHAQALAQTLEGRSAGTLPAWIQWCLIVFCGASGLVIGRAPRLKHNHLLTDFGAAGVLALMSVVVFWAFETTFPFVSTLVTFIAAVAIGNASQDIFERHEDA